MFLNRSLIALLSALTTSLAVAQANSRDLSALSARDTLLVIAPHPDDESLCCAGLIDLARRAGAHVAIAWVTVGDGSRSDAMIVGRRLLPGRQSYQLLARRRVAQARQAALLLNVPSDAQYVLAYPDRGIRALAERFYANPLHSRRTGEQTVFLSEAVTPGAAYEGQNLERDLVWILEQARPTWVLAPSPRDAHPDHHGVALLAMRVMEQRGELDHVRYWIVHGGRGWPAPRAFRPDLPQTPPPRGQGMAWETVSLDERALDAKRRAVEAHWSQVRVMGRTLKSYVRATELYSRTPEAPSGPLQLASDWTCAPCTETMATGVAAP